MSSNSDPQGGSTDVPVYFEFDAVLKGFLSTMMLKLLAAYTGFLEER